MVYLNVLTREGSVHNPTPKAPIVQKEVMMVGTLYEFSTYFLLATAKSAESSWGM